MFFHGEYYEQMGKEGRKTMKRREEMLTKILKQASIFSIFVFQIRVIHFLICTSGFNLVVCTAMSYCMSIQVNQLDKRTVYIKISRAALVQFTLLILPLLENILTVGKKNGH